MTTEETLVQLLIEKNWHISFAESCTAGLASATLCNVSGASSIFDAGIITYANEAKIKYLNVNKESIDKYGVVSETVAREMSIGICEANHAEVGGSITGIAGPTGGTKEKPVGTVCFGVCIKGDTYTSTQHFGPLDRQFIREKSVQFLMNFIVELIKSSY